MFTGVIKATAKVKKSERKRGSLFLTIDRPRGWKIRPGDSIATDGVCLTVKEVSHGDYRTELMRETLSKTSFGTVVPKRVSLENPLKVSDVLDGHLVLGHVDAVGEIKNIRSAGSSKVYQISFPKKFAKLVTDKGSIAVDGVSLTVVKVHRNWFTVSLVDYTIKHTGLGMKKVGDFVNLEFDILAKYLVKLMDKKST